VSQFNQLLSRKRGAIFYAFDLLWLDGADLRRRPLLERKARLAELVRVSNCPRLLYAQHVEGAGKDLCGNLPTAPRKNCRQIGHLRSLRAPGLAPDLEQIADKYAEKKRQLGEKVKLVEQKVRAVEEHVKALDGESEPGAAAQVKAFTHYKLGYAHANVEAIRLLEKSAQQHCRIRGWDSG